MNKEIATKVFESLASGIRLEVYRLVVKTGLEGMLAGQIASELAIAPNNLSFHLRAITQDATGQPSKHPKQQEVGLQNITHQVIICRLMGGSVCPFQQLDLLQLAPDLIMGLPRGNRPVAVEPAQLGSKKHNKIK